MSTWINFPIAVCCRGTWVRRRGFMAPVRAQRAGVRALSAVAQYKNATVQQAAAAVKEGSHKYLDVR